MKKIFYFTFPVMLLPSLFTWFRWDTPAVAVTGLEYFLERWMGVAAAVLIYYVSGVPSLQKDSETSNSQSIGIFRPSTGRIEQSSAHFLLLLSWIRAYFYWPTMLGLSNTFTASYHKGVSFFFWLQGLAIVIHWAAFILFSKRHKGGKEI